MAEALIILIGKLGINASVFTLVILILFIVSEVLASIPKVKASSVFQLISGIIASLYNKIKR